ncbi:MAG: translation initiation factor [Tenuifilaceae bacterium]|nr:translation initiation factor [Tenuifilaceae bacterium]
MTDWKDKLKFAYSTNPDYKPEEDETQQTKTLDPNKQDIRVWLEKKNRGGKVVSIISGFIGSDDDLKELGKILKTRCGVGGTAKDGEIIIQGDFRDRIIGILLDLGYKKVKKAGG